MGMIFSRNDLTFRLIEVLEIRETNVKKRNAGRHFAALSLRCNSDAKIHVSDGCIPMRSGSVAFFPADLDYTRTAGHDEMIVIHFEVYNYDGHEVETYVTENFERTCELFREMYAIWNRDTPDRYYRATEQLYRIFSYLLSDCSLRDSADTAVVRGAKEIMQQAYPDPCFSMKELAAELNVSQEYVRRVFRTNTGLTPKQYLQQLRFRRAAALLTSGYYTVRQVAEMCGFLDEKYFSTAFRKATGVPPSKYIYRFSG